MPSGPPGRVEIPFTAAHWEVAFIAAEVPIARGWERQVDMDRNEILYEDDLTLAEYRHWIDDHAVRWIALPDVDLDEGGKAEAALLEHDVPWLRLVRTTEHWRIWEVVDAAPIVEAPGRGSSSNHPTRSSSRSTSREPSSCGPGTCRTGRPDRATARASRRPTTACSRWSSPTPGFVHLRPEFSLDPLLTDESSDACGDAEAPPVATTARRAAVAPPVGYDERRARRCWPRRARRLAVG